MDIITSSPAIPIHEIIAAQRQAYLSQFKSHIRKRPVASLPKGTMNRRCTDWEPVPGDPTRERRLHYTKGWRTRRV